MSKHTSSTILSILAGLVLLIGTVASTSSLLRYPSIKRQQTKDIASSKLLMDLENKFGKLDIQTAPLKKLNYTNLPDPEILTKDIFGSSKIENIQQDKNNYGTEYAINHIEISLKDIELKKLPAYIRTMETLRPPLRLTRCKISASTTTSGSGSINLKFERVELQQKQP